MAVNRVSPRIGKVVDIPNGVPTIGTATAGAEAATVAFTAPATSATGGPIFSYRAVSSPGSIVGTGTTSPITVSGLTVGTSYTFTVAAANPTGTGVYSAASNSIVPTPLTSFESIASATVTSTDVVFSNIPQTYRHLQIRFRLNANAAGNGGITGRMRINGATSGYVWHYVKGNGSTAQATGATGTSSFGYMPLPTNASGAGTNIYLVGIVDIPNYTTSQVKVPVMFSGLDTNNNSSVHSDTGYIGHTSGYLADTNPITVVSFINDSSFNMAGEVALYGIKES